MNDQEEAARPSSQEKKRWTRRKKKRASELAFSLLKTSLAESRCEKLVPFDSRAM